MTDAHHSIFSLGEQWRHEALWPSLAVVEVKHLWMYASTPTSTCHGAQLRRTRLLISHKIYFNLRRFSVVLTEPGN
jgi:hypothetical protein